MFLDSASAKALAAIILVSTQGVDRLNPQLPLVAVNRGANWLIKGTPYTDTVMKKRFCMASIFFDKRTSQVKAINFSARQILSEAEAKHWHQVMTRQDFDRVFGPPTVFEPDCRYLDMNTALYGGVVNKPADAVAYAYILMQLTPSLAGIPKQDLQAEERTQVWHIFVSTPGQIKRREILTFSRYDGKLLSGNL